MRIDTEISESDGKKLDDLARKHLRSRRKMVRYIIELYLANGDAVKGSRSK
jgi:hypothetical protein